MLQSFDRISRLPPDLEFVRDLEWFEGPILSEYRAVKLGAVYLEKWCARERDVARFLLVRSDQKSLAEYLACRISLLDLLTTRSDGVGFLVDRRGAETVALWVAALEHLPPEYLPRDTAFHEESLRPEWETAPQSFLLDEGWNGKRIADVERRFLNVSGFAYFTEPDIHRTLPMGILDFNYDRGFPIAAAFNRIRATVPWEERSKPSSVAASSPGVLTLEATNATAARIATTLRALPGSIRAYEELYGWSRTKPADVAERMPEVSIARRDFRTVCGMLSIREETLLPPSQIDNPIAVLTAGKLVAAYWRQLWRLLSGEDGAEFISVNVSATETTVVLGDDEDEEGVA